VPAKVTAVPANPQADIRRDYELALQVGTKAALNAFLAQYPDGFYAELARSQLAKIAAEEARVAATEKAVLAEQERARLAAEGAQKGQQAKAEADAKAAEQARIAAEKAKQAAQEQLTAAEQKRTAIETSAAGKENMPPESKVVADNKAADQVAAGEPAAAKTQPTNVAALTDGSPQADIAKSVQIELRRVGCLTGAADGEWNAASQRSMALFNRHAGAKLNVKVASTDALDAIKLKPSRVCPLICEHGFKAHGNSCRRISCARGSFLNDDNECEKRRVNKPEATRNTDDRTERPVRERQRPLASAGKTQSSGQIVCDRTGCKPVDRGCHIESRATLQAAGDGGNVQVCN